MAEELVVVVWVRDWEIQCCREPPFEGKAWNEIVVLGGSASIRRDEPARACHRDPDGSTTAIGAAVGR